MLVGDESGEGGSWLVVGGLCALTSETEILIPTRHLAGYLQQVFNKAPFTVLKSADPITYL